MAATAVEAFGHYLRQLRERRGLSLDDVVSLSSTFPDPVGKGYLSRCENGKLKIAFSKTIALSRIYEVPPEVLAERMRLDLEVDRIGAPDTSEVPFVDMFRRASEAAHSGKLWPGYAWMRDASRLAGTRPLIRNVRDEHEQKVAVQISVASVAGTLGANRFALFELENVDPTSLGVHYRAVLLDRLQSQHRFLGDLDKAAELGDEAIHIARSNGLAGILPPLIENRAKTFLLQRRFDEAIACQQEAIQGYDGDLYPADLAYAHLRLAEIYIEATRMLAARKILLVTLRKIRSIGLVRTEAQALCLIGDVEYGVDRKSAARKVWREAAALARKQHDLSLVFRIDVRLFRYARESGDDASARALDRRLRRLLPSVSRRIPEVDEYLRITA